VLAVLRYLRGNGFWMEAVSDTFKNVSQEHLFGFQFNRKTVAYPRHKNYENKISIQSLCFAFTRCFIMGAYAG
jgi:hypothetical protein